MFSNACNIFASFKFHSSYIIIMKVNVVSLIVTCVRIERSTLFQEESCIRTLRFFVFGSQSDNRKVVCKNFYETN